MPYDSAGNFTRVHNWEDDRINDIDIVSDRHDEEDDNFAAGLSECMLRDGRSTMTGNLKMGSYQVTGMANGTRSTDAVNKSQLDSANSNLTKAYTAAINTMLSKLYPVGSLYFGTQTTCPLASLISGSKWTLVGNGRALWGGNGSNANTTIEAGLPNITGQTQAQDGYLRNPAASGAFQAVTVSGSPRSGDGGSTSAAYFTFNASRSNALYGKSSTVQPPAYVINVWRRTA